MNPVESFKIYAQNLMIEHLRMIENGEISFGFSNQFDQTILESALENIDDKVEEVYGLLNIEEYGYYSAFDGSPRFNAVSLAMMFSEFEPPEIDYSWVD